MKNIGNLLKERMKKLNINISELSNKTFCDEEFIIDILNNKITIDNINEFDFSLICSTLHCNLDYFAKKGIDFYDRSFNLDVDNDKSMSTKIKINDFINDYIFTKNILSEID